MNKSISFLQLEEAAKRFSSAKDRIEQILVAEEFLRIGNHIVEEGYFSELENYFEERSVPGEMKVYDISLLCGDLMSYYEFWFEILMRGYDLEYQGFLELKNAIATIEVDRYPEKRNVLLKKLEPLSDDMFSRIGEVAQHFLPDFPLSMIISELEKSCPEHNLFSEEVYQP